MTLRLRDQICDWLTLGYPDLETTAGYWKFCSLYDWENHVKGSRSLYTGPVFKLLKRP